MKIEGTLYYFGEIEPIERSFITDDPMIACYITEGIIRDSIDNHPDLILYNADLPQTVRDYLKVLEDCGAIDLGIYAPNITGKVIN